MPNGKERNIEVSVIMPCLNEEETIGICVEKAKRAFSDLGVKGEVVVCDNGSTDNSVEIAGKAGAKVVFESKPGYGEALKGGFRAASGRYLIMGDADNTYDFSQIGEFIKHLWSGSDFVIGNRFLGRIEKGAMPYLHQLGSPVLSGLLKRWYGVPARDAHCGLRAISREAYDKLDLRTSGMEFASEMIVKASFTGLKIKEIPIDYYLRKGEAKLRTFRDGWRHLRFLLLFSPSRLFLIPGLILFSLGLIILIPMTFGPLKLGNLTLHLHPMFLAALLVILGMQVLSFGLFSKTIAFLEGFVKKDRIVEWFLKNSSLERMILFGSLIAFLGFGVGAVAFANWANSGFGALFEVRKLIFAVAFFILGIQIIFSAFFFNVLKTIRK